MNILITGGAGYIGSMLIKRFISNPVVKKIIVIDLLKRPPRIEDNDKVLWIQTDLAIDGWQSKVLERKPIDLIIHAAFKIRNPFGHIASTKHKNLTACHKVFQFCFNNGIKKLIYLSSAAAYGANPENIGKLLKEDDPLKEKISPYGSQKRLVEKLLQKFIKEKNPTTKTIVLRLNSVTGPLGQSLKSKFGLITFLKKLMPFIIETHPAWARQFVHEDDAEEVIYKLSFEYSPETNFEIFNIAPEKFLTAKDISKSLKKKIIKAPIWLIKLAFRISWPLTLGKLPTPPGSENSFIYPINLDGTKIKKIGFNYRYSAEDALLANKGKYL